MAELDPVIHVQARLRILTILTASDDGDSLSFPRLQALAEVTSGNLATHLRKLEEAEYIHVEKVIQGRTPVTYVSMTPDGRDAFRRYKRQLRALLEASD